MARVTKLTSAEADACREMLAEARLAYAKAIERVRKDAGIMSDNKNFLAAKQYASESFDEMDIAISLNTESPCK